MLQEVIAEPDELTTLIKSGESILIEFHHDQSRELRFACVRQIGDNSEIVIGAAEVNDRPRGMKLGLRSLLDRTIIFMDDTDAKFGEQYFGHQGRMRTCCMDMVVGVMKRFDLRLDPTGLDG